MEKDKDYEVYKDALNEPTNEVLLSDFIFCANLCSKFRLDFLTFYGYVRSKQNVWDKVGPLEDNAGNIITQGVLNVMAEELNNT